MDLALGLGYLGELEHRQSNHLAAIATFRRSVSLFEAELAGRLQP